MLQIRDRFGVGLRIGVLAAGLLLPGADARAIVTTGEGLDVAEVIGADRWYDAGYTGSRTNVANVEAGHAWSAHSSISLAGLYHGSGGVGSFDDHATAVAFAMAGRGSNAASRGIAYDATLRSGAIATQINGRSFSFNGFSYREGLAPNLGLGGTRADVINFSWGDSSAIGNEWLLASTDGAVAQSGSLIVVSSGNSGAGVNQVGSPARGYNVLSVGALADEDDGFSRRAGFSSGGAVSYLNPSSNVVVNGVRPAVDLLAPGTDLTLASLRGADSFTGNRQGTSFAAPIAAGAAALLVDAGRDRFNGGTSIDPRTQKAVLMNSARKISGWDNGQRAQNGAIVTTQALDFEAGAGALDMDRAFDQFLAGDTDLAGASGGTVGEIGWDFASVSQGDTTDYRFASALEAGSVLTLTMSWQADARWNVFGNYNDVNASYLSLDDLDLEVWRLDASGDLDALVARSENRYDTVEHLSFEISATADYLFRATWDRENYDRIGDANTTDFAIAWSGVLADIAVPAPATIPIIVFAFRGFASRRRPS